MSRRSFQQGEWFHYWKKMELYPYYDPSRMIESGKYDNLKEELLCNHDNEINIRNFNIMWIPSRIFPFVN